MTDLMRRLRHPLVAALLFFAVAYAIFLGNPNFPREDDEGLYIAIAKSMASENEWFKPTWFGALAFYKPPLLYWAMRVSFIPFGETLLGGRVPSLLFTLLILFLVYRLGASLKDPKTGLLALFLAGTCVSSGRFARSGMLDAAWSLCLFAAMVEIAKLHKGDEKASWLVAGAALGGALLVKGPVAVPIVLAFIFFAGLFRGGWRPFFSRWSLAFAGTALGVGAIWPLSMWAKGEWETWWTFFIIRENFGKFHDLYYPLSNLYGYFLVHFLPWSFLFLASLGLLLWKKAWKEAEFSYPLAMMAAIFLVFTLPETRLVHYSFPALPAGALLVAAAYSRWKETPVMKGACLLTAIVLGIIGLSFIPAWMIFGNTFLFMALGLLSLAAAVQVLHPDALSSPWTGRLFLPLALAARKLPPNALFRSAVFFGCVILLLSVFSGLWPFPFITPEGKEAIHQKGTHIVRISPFQYSLEAEQRLPQLQSREDVIAVLAKGERVLINEEYLKEMKVPKKLYREIASWPILKRRIRNADLKTAYKAADSLPLAERMIVLEGISQPGER
ncbi:MAG: glycosyltransferase family 39 protein [Armatimonadetes bacterium]|nr:glycosyltransferase family 39 protein [Armatimonadota bacterium]